MSFVSMGEKGIYGLIAANEAKGYLTGTDLLGEEVSEDSQELNGGLSLAAIVGAGRLVRSGNVGVVRGSNVSTRKYNTNTMKHIYHGEINRRGKAVGYHHESMLGGKVIPGTEKKPDKNGVYEAKVEIDGVEKVAKSSFFPKEWNRVDVLKAIEESYNSKRQIGPNKYVGETSSGIKIEMYVNKDGSIATAYPLYNK